MTLCAPLAAPLAGTPAPTHAAGNSLYFPGGGDHVTVGPNAAIFIDGTITYDDNCRSGGTRPGIDDFVYPATDVYIVPAGSTGDDSPLEDAGGNGPNTIVGTGGGAFIGELIAVTNPSGSLGAGVYDIVYDTCQDGVVGWEDEVFYDAITVVFPEGELPPVSGSIQQLKDKARQEYVAWLATHTGLTALFKLDEARAIASCLMAPSPTCLIEVWAKIKSWDSPLAQPISWFKDQTLKLVMNRAKNYGAIWQDPADPDFQQLPVIRTEDVTVPPATDSAIADALAGLTEPLAREGALADALLHALERYQGAQAAGDAAWALVQARAVRDLSEALAEQLTTDTSVQALRDTLAADIDGIVARANEGVAVINRVRSTGLTPAERRELANRGFDAAAMAAIETRFVADGHQPQRNAAAVLGVFDQLLAARTGMIGALQESVAGWDSLATALAAKVNVAVPTAAAGGPYVNNGGQVQLDASGSTTPEGSTLVSYDWDLDGDGEFDDATGVSPTVTLDGAAVVALRVVNDVGLAAVDAAVIAGTLSASPAIHSANPNIGGVTVTVGASQAFTVVAPGAVSYEWTSDAHTLPSTGGTFVYEPTLADVGERVITATVTGPNGRQATHSWWVSTLAVDADGDGWTATTDCDDTRADVHPGGFERIGNGRDDDCDPRTPDEPVGGISGQVWSWGVSTALGRTPPSSNDPMPKPIPTLADDVRFIEATFAGGFALLTDGTVRAWGQNNFGRLGDGTQTVRYAPVVVQNVGGGGALGNVIELASDSDHVLARLADGSVRAWGWNSNRQLGDDSTVTTRLTPVVVLDEAREPVVGAAQVETGENVSYIVMDDGTVKVAGVNFCNGSNTIERNTVATTNVLFGNQVVQLASGDHGGAIVLNADGSVHACSTYRPLIGRGSGSIPYAQQVTPLPVHGFGPGSGAIDVAHGMAVNVALKEDGTVWTWGRNVNHELDVLGLAAGATQWSPAQVPLPPGPPIIDVETDYAATIFATRADGSVLVWGANVNAGGGVGNFTYQIAGTPTIDLGDNVAISVKNATWNGLALVRPRGPAVEPVLPIHWIDVAAHDAQIDEATGGEVVIDLTHPAPHDVTVEYEFDGAAGTVVIPAGSTSVSVPVTVTDDALDEDDEELAFTITAVSNGAHVARWTAVVTVVDDDAPPTASVLEMSTLEGDTSLTEVKVVLQLSGPSGRDIVVDYTTVDGTAVASATPGDAGDYRASHGEVFIPAGSMTGVVHLSVIGDTVMETTEHFFVQITGADHATIDGASAAIAIVDDEPLLVTVGSPTVLEGDEGTTDAPFTLTITPLPEGETVSLAWSLAPGTAELSSDVVPGTGQLVFDSTTTSADVVAAVVADTIAEPLAVETFRLALGSIVSSYGRPVIVADAPLAKIIDDDTDTDPAPISVDAGPDVAGGEGSPVGLSGSVDGAGGSATISWTVDTPLCSIADPSALDTSVTCVDEVVALLTLTVSDGIGASASDSAKLAVHNVAPTVILSSPTQGAAFGLGTPVSVVALVTDPGANDVLTCTIVWGDGTEPSPCGSAHVYATAGPFLIEVIADDGDGGIGSSSVEVMVSSPGPAPSWPFDGFYQPVDNVPAVNLVKAGSTVPLKFGLGGDRGMDIFAPGYPASVQRPCDGQAGELLEATGTPGESQLTYDPDTGRYHYNWKTERSWAGTCRQLVLRFADGTQAVAEFRFK